MEAIARFLLCISISAWFVSAQPNKAPQQKQAAAQPKEPITVVVQEQKISTGQAKEKSENNPPHWYTPFERPDWLLFIAAILTCVAVFRQASEATKATNAMRDGLKLQYETLRPRLTIGGGGDSPFMDMINGKNITVDIKFINTGGTPAYGVVPETWLEFLDMASPIFTSAAVHQIGGKITVHPHQPAPFRIPLGRALTAPEIAKLKAIQATLYLRIRLVYDAFGKEKFTDYVFHITPTLMNIEKCEAN